MKSGFVIALATFLAGLGIRTCYEMLKRVGTVKASNKPLFVFVALVMFCLWTAWFSMCPRDPLHVALPDAVRWIGLGIFAAGLVLAVGALIQLKGVENIDHLVTTGLFARLRHPMYLGFILWIFGWAIFHGAGASAIAGLVAIGNIFFWRHLEEEHLERTYGDEYFTYRKRTWF